MNENSALLSLLGLAKKAGKLTAGHDAVLESLKRRKSVLILLAADASPRLEAEMQREIVFLKADLNIIRMDETMEDIGRALPKKAAVLSVNDASFAAGIMKLVRVD